jgi:D-xylose transport system substrate-binding protein
VTRTLAILVLAGLALPACSKQEGPQVAFLVATLHEERYQKDVRYFEARAKELGLRVVTLAANNDNAKQIAQVEAVLARGAKVLVIQPTDSQAASSYVRLAHEKGAKVVAYDRAIIAPDLDYFVSHDSYRVGVLQAQAALQATGNKRRATRSPPKSRAATRTRSRHTSHAARSRSCSSGTTARGRRSKRCAPSRMR